MVKFESEVGHFDSFAHCTSKTLICDLCGNKVKALYWDEDEQLCEGCLLQRRRVEF